LVRQACRSADVDPLDVIDFDLRDLRAKPYLTPYFESIEGSAGREERPQL
jgi:hypothetical protein